MTAGCSRAAILCPGPSLYAVECDWGQYDEIVGVTDAIAMADVPFTVLCNQESCGHKSQVRYQRWGESVEKNSVDIWGLPRISVRWNAHWGIPTERIKSVSAQDVLDGLAYEGPRRRYGSGPYSYLRAAYEGFSEICIYGSDFRGDCNYDPNTGEEVQRTIGSGVVESPLVSWDGRWDVEREMFESFSTWLLGRGVRLELMS